MDNFQKYSRLSLLFVGGFIAFILFIALFVFVMRLFSIALFHTPGFDFLFRLTILMVPYLIFLAAYYYLVGKIRLSGNRASRVFAIFLLVPGAIIYLFTLTLSVMTFLNMDNAWLKIFDRNTHYTFIVQLIILLIAAGVIAGGDVEEKDWMERESSNEL